MTTRESFNHAIKRWPKLIPVLDAP